MKQAIVTGSNGFIGSAVIKKLLENKIEVLSISRKKNNVINPNSNNNLLTQIYLDLKNIDLLPKEISNNNWPIGNECVFYNFAWSGSQKLMDGTIEDQLLNVKYSANSVKIASQIGCCKFINSGSIEESFAEHHIKKFWSTHKFKSNNVNYAISKIASRNMCNLLAYLNKIDYVHTRFSAVIDKDLKGSGYISDVLRKIKNDQPYENPSNEGLFDIIDIEDLSNAYYFLGINGINKIDYFIGSGFPQKLVDYFVCFENLIKHNKLTPLKTYDEFDYFSVSDFTRETKLNLTDSYINVIQKINKS
jgi:UDP-glucose 4-epimerase